MNLIWGFGVDVRMAVYKLWWACVLHAICASQAQTTNPDENLIQGRDVKSGEYPGIDEDSRTMDLSEFYHMQTGV